MARKSLKSAWADSGTALGAWCVLPGSVHVEAIAGMGFDYVGIDAQHGLIDEDMTLRMVQAVDLGSAAPIVRVPWNDPSLLGKVLDFGAAGAIIPMIGTAADAERAVSACRYAPDGARSFGPTRVGLRDGPSYFAEANENIAVIPMIETREALDNLDDIVAVEGVDALYVGPFDLSVSLGLPPRNNDGTPAFDDALARVLDVCRNSGVIPAIHSDPRMAAKRLEQGFRMVTCAIDLAALYGGMKSALDTASKVMGAPEKQ